MAATTLEIALKQQCLDFLLVFVNKSILSSIICKDLESKYFSNGDAPYNRTQLIFKINAVMRGFCEDFMSM